MWSALPWKLPLKAPSSTPAPATPAAASAAVREARKTGASAGRASFRKTPAAASSATPKTLFTVSIHGPLFGSDTEKAPIRKKRSPSPSAYANMMPMPKTTEPLVATKASAAARTGPVHGAAMTPDTSPMPTAPR